MYHETEDRVPMTDWYYTVSANQVVYHLMPPDNYPKGFQNRTVQGGLYAKLLEYSGKMKVRLPALDDRTF